MKYPVDAFVSALNLEQAMHDCLHFCGRTHRGRLLPPPLLPPHLLPPPLPFHLTAAHVKGLTSSSSLMFRLVQDFPSRGFSRFLSCRGYLLPKEWENLLPASPEAKDLYNLGAMQIYARRLCPDALFDPRYRGLFFL